MLSDLAIIKSICKPYLTTLEQNSLLEEIQDHDYYQVALVLINRLDLEMLTESQYKKYKNHIYSDRFAKKILNLFEMGAIDQSTLMLYGISGNLPDPEYYAAMSHEEKLFFWQERFSIRLGLNWQGLVKFNLQREEPKNWSKNGF